MLKNKTNPHSINMSVLHPVAVTLLASSLLISGCGGNSGDTSSEATSQSSLSSSNSSSSSSSPSNSTTLRVQEQSAGLCSFLGLVEAEHGGFAGEGYFNSSNEVGASIGWSIHSENAQQITVSVQFANGGETARTALLEVNNGDTDSIEMPFASTQSWTQWDSADVSVAVDAGDNHFILASVTSAGLANVDYIEINGTDISTATCQTEDGEGGWTTTVPYTVSGQDGIHDPSTILKDGDRYWTFGTGIGAGKPINALYSYDLITWNSGPSPIPANTYPSWIDQKLPVFDGNFWAPDIIKMNGRYYLYYSAFSSTVLNSAIGVMVTDSLNNPNWQDLGMVVSTQDEPRSSRNEPVNAIDAGLYRDNDGRVWMIYGSHYAGIFIREINPATGLLMNNNRYNAAGNNGGWNEYEAAQVQYLNGYYYLFINLGDCCQQLDSDYIMYVARSESPTGPFITQSGHNLWNGDIISQQQVDAGVTTGSVLASQPGFVGPGHFGYINNFGQDLASIHYYGGNDGWGHLRLLEMTFVNGWPVLNYNFQLRQ